MPRRLVLGPHQPVAAVRGLGGGILTGHSTSQVTTTIASLVHVPQRGLSPVAAATPGRGMSDARERRGL